MIEEVTVIAELIGAVDSCRENRMIETDRQTVNSCFDSTVKFSQRMTQVLLESSSSRCGDPLNAIQDWL